MSDLTLIRIHTVQDRDETVLVRETVIADWIVRINDEPPPTHPHRSRLIFHDAGTLPVTETRMQLVQMINGLTREQNGVYYVNGAIPTGWDD